MSNYLSFETLHLVFGDWCRDKVQGRDKGIRFGQYVYNKYSYEVESSYNEPDWVMAYEMIAKALNNKTSGVKTR